MGLTWRSCIKMVRNRMMISMLSQRWMVLMRLSLVLTFSIIALALPESGVTYYFSKMYKFRLRYFNF